MTVSTDRTQRFNVDQMVRLAYQLVGMLNAAQSPTTAQKQQGYAFLKLILDETQGDGFMAHQIAYEEVTLTAGTFQYDLDESTEEAFGDGMYISAGQSTAQASGETLVIQMAHADWQVRSAKDAQGRPNEYLCVRNQVPAQVWLWPVPIEAGTIRFQVRRNLAAVNDGNVTLEFPRQFHSAIVHRLAGMLGQAATLPHAAEHILIGEKKTEKAVAHASQRVGQQAFLSHRSGRHR